MTQLTRALDSSKGKVEYNPLPELVLTNRVGEFQLTSLRASTLKPMKTSHLVETGFQEHIIESIINANQNLHVNPEKKLSRCTDHWARNSDPCFLKTPELDNYYKL